MNSKERIHYLDIAKGISMIAIVAGHLGNGPINQFVFTFHVPIFFLLSGYFMKPMDDIPFIKKKAKQLLLPYIITCGFIIFRCYDRKHHYDTWIFTGRLQCKVLVSGSGIWQWNN